MTVSLILDMIDLNYFLGFVSGTYSCCLNLELLQDLVYS